MVAAWRVLVGVWAPKHWDLSLSSLAQYTIPAIPAQNPWVDRTRVRPGSATPPASPELTPVQMPAGSPGSTSSRTRTKGHRRPPSRRLVRHVLRARVEAAKALSEMFAHLEKSPKDKAVRASSHLARAYGGTVDEPAEQSGITPLDEPAGWRSAREVVSFLRKRGARIASLQDDVSGGWAAALSSDAEGFESEGGISEDMMFVPSSSSSDVKVAS